MRRGSKKPCPGCGEVKEWRRADEVCDDCKYLLKRARWMKEQLEKDDDEIVISFGKVSHWNQHIHTKAQTGRRLMDILHRIAMGGSRRSTSADSEFNLLGKIDCYEPGTYYAIMPRELAEGVRDLREAIQQSLDLEYKKGKMDGHNLLVRLASGDLAVNDFVQETGR